MGDYKIYEYNSFGDLVKETKTKYIQIIGKISMPDRYLISIEIGMRQAIALDFSKLESAPDKVMYVHMYGRLICLSETKKYIEVDFFQKLFCEELAKQRVKNLNKIHGKLSKLKLSTFNERVRLRDKAPSPIEELLRFALETRRIKQTRQMEQIPQAIKQESLHIKKEPISIEQESLHIKEESFSIKQEPFSMEQDDLLHIKEEPFSIKQEPLHIKEDPLDMEQDPLHIKEEPFSIKQEPLHIKEEPLDLEQDQMYIKELFIEHEPLHIKEEPLDMVQENYNFNQEIDLKKERISKKRFRAEHEGIVSKRPRFIERQEP